MYIKSFYALCVAFVAMFVQVFMLFTMDRTPGALAIIAVLAVVAGVALFIADVLQHHHNRLQRMHRAYEYSARRRKYGFAI